MKEHFDHQKAETQREQMRNEIDRMKRLLENNDNVVHKQASTRVDQFAVVLWLVLVLLRVLLLMMVPRRVPRVSRRASAPCARSLTYELQLEMSHSTAFYALVCAMYA